MSCLWFEWTVFLYLFYLPLCLQSVSFFYRVTARLCQPLPSIFFGLLSGKRSNLLAVLTYLWLEGALLLEVFVRLL